MVQPLIGFLAFAVGIVVVAMAPVLAVWLIMQVLKALGFVIGGAVKVVAGTLRHVARFVRGEVVDSLQFGGSLLTAGVVIPLAIANLCLARLRAARHYGTAAEDEIVNALACLYRVGVGHPVRLVGLGALTDGLERRLPDLMEAAPQTGAHQSGTASSGLFGWRSRRRAMASRGDALRRGSMPQFEGYTMQDELRPGGSGARLFSAIPTQERAGDFLARGLHAPAKVVIKAFDLGYGSTIPQIVRESRSLEAAKSLGLILEHAIDEDSFHYVMPFVPGDDLDTATRALHATAGPEGLTDPQLKAVLGYARDLCDHLDRFHRGGLWHKDIKPSNLMVADHRLQVVDFGLVTPLESALTLTTHGTEFFRDPELVRLALAGKRVKDVDGVKFDVYSAGAVLYSMVENSFPAHGSLSSISKRVPDALRWIVRRAMADIDKRYSSGTEFGRDLDVLIGAKDPFAVLPAQLPSVGGYQEQGQAKARTHAATFQSTPFSADTPVKAGGNAEHHSAAAPPRAAEDVTRFEAFGMRADVHGLGRIRTTMKAAREEHRAKREAHKAARARAVQEKRSARETAKKVRRRRRRGVMGAFGTLLVFGLIGGGVATLIQDQRGGDSDFARSRSRFVSAEAASIEGPRSSALYGDQARAIAARLVDEANQKAAGASDAALFLASQGRAPWQPTSPVASTSASGSKWTFASSIEEDLRSMKPGTRVLVVADPKDSGLIHLANSAAARLESLQLKPVGIAASHSASVSSRDQELVARAVYAIEKYRPSRMSVEAILSRFLLESDGVGAILHLHRSQATRHMRTTLVASESSSARDETSCSAGLDEEGTSRGQSSGCTTASSSPRAVTQ